MFPPRCDTTQALKIAKVLFRITEVEGIYYVAKNMFSHDVALIIFMFVLMNFHDFPRNQFQKVLLLTRIFCTQENVQPLVISVLKVSCNYLNIVWSKVLMNFVLL